MFLVKIFITNGTPPPLPAVAYLKRGASPSPKITIYLNDGFYLRKKKRNSK
jgi:hypothetical protein